MKRTTVIVSAMLVLVAQQAFAEAERGLEQGDRVRVRTKDASASYTLQGFHGDTLYVLTEAGGDPTRIAVREVEKIEVRVPRSKTAGALWGVAIGGVIGGAIGMGYAIATVDEVEDVECGPELGDEVCNTSIDVARVVGYTFAFGAPGMLLGGIIGASVPGERWQRVDLPGTVSVRPGRDGTVFLEYTLSF